MPRISSHKIADQAVNILRNVVTNYSGERKVSAIFREITGRDYGVDALIEVFENDNPTGKIAFVQVKGTGERILPLKRTPELIACKDVSMSSINYAFQTHIPMLLFYISVKERQIYYLKLQTEVDSLKINKKLKKIQLKIPISNHLEGNFRPIIEIIQENFKK